MYSWIFSLAILFIIHARVEAIKCVVSALGQGNPLQNGQLYYNYLTRENEVVFPTTEQSDCTQCAAFVVNGNVTLITGHFTVRARIAQCLRENEAQLCSQPSSQVEGVNLDFDSPCTRLCCSGNLCNKKPQLEPNCSTNIFVEKPAVKNTATKRIGPFCMSGVNDSFVLATQCVEEADKCVVVKGTAATLKQKHDITVAACFSQLEKLSLQIADKAIPSIAKPILGTFLRGSCSKDSIIQRYISVNCCNNTFCNIIKAAPERLKAQPKVADKLESIKEVVVYDNRTSYAIQTTVSPKVYIAMLLAAILRVNIN